MHYVYVDWTTDSDPYPYYVGCGTLNRVGKKYRNTYHRNIAQKHGFNRVIVQIGDRLRKSSCEARDPIRIPLSAAAA